MLLFFADLEGLKHINDQFGHREGDRALSLAAASIKNTFCDSDITARLSGDEFVVLILQDADRAAHTLCQKLKANLAAYAETECRYHLTLSIGVAHFDPDHPISLQELMKQADAALYHQKRVSRQHVLSGSTIINGVMTPARRNKQSPGVNHKEPADKNRWLPLVALEPTIPRVRPSPVTSSHD